MSDEQTEILRNIWVEMKTLNGRVNETNQGLATTNKGLDETNKRLDETNKRLGETNKRLDNLTLEVRQGFAQVDRRFDAFLLGAHGQEHTELKQRMERVEKHLGLSE